MDKWCEKSRSTLTRISFHFVFNQFELLIFTEITQLFRLRFMLHEIYGVSLRRSIQNSNEPGSGSNSRYCIKLFYIHIKTPLKCFTLFMLMFKVQTMLKSYLFLFYPTNLRYSIEARYIN